MAELLFGSLPQLWPSVPTAGLGSLPGLTASRTGMIVQTPQSDPAPSIGVSWPTALPIGTAPANVDVAAGVTPQALLATIALRRGQPAGPTSDQDVEEFIYDALDLLPGTNDIEARCDGGRITLTGSVPHKRLKRDAGEIVWAIPSVNDVQNNITIATRRRARAQRDPDAASAPGSSRKTA